MRACPDHWEYVCVWVDDMLITSKQTEDILKTLSKEYTLKGVGEPEYYLGADMKHLKQPEDVFIMGSETYIGCCITIYEQLFGQ